MNARAEISQTPVRSIRGNNLSVVYGGHTVLDGVDLTLETNQLTGLIGPNGAGKTTLLRAFLGLAPSEGGQIWYGDKPAENFSPRERARVIAYMAQGSEIHWPMTARAIVELGRMPHRHPWRSLSPADKAWVEKAMWDTTVQEFAERPVTSLSGGEKARVLLARAMAPNTPFLFADEPAASLDPHFQLEMLSLLKRQVGPDRGVVVVMHDLNLAQQYCDRLIVVANGKVYADGAPDTVMTDEMLAHVFQVQMSRWSENGSRFMVPVQRNTP